MKITYDGCTQGARESALIIFIVGILGGVVLGGLWIGGAL